MADEEKAKELTTELICNKCEEIKHCKIIGTDKCITYIRSLNAILQGYKKGFEEGRKEKCFEQNNDGTIHPCEVMKVCEEIEEGAKVIAKENAELKEQLKNNPYVQLLQKEKAELAEDFAKQIEKMKNKLNCSKYHYCLCKDKTCKDCKDWELDG